jgi:hypothetical protein
MGAPAGGHGVVPGGAERAEEQHVGLIERLAAEELPSPICRSTSCRSPSPRPYWCAGRRRAIGSSGRSSRDEHVRAGGDGPRPLYVRVKLWMMRRARPAAAHLPDVARPLPDGRRNAPTFAEKGGFCRG